MERKTGQQVMKKWTELPVGPDHWPRLLASCGPRWLVPSVGPSGKKGSA